MSIVVMNRIDDRLIHGQVITGWTKLRNVTSILIVDDGVAKNQMMLDIFRFAAPPGVKLEAVTVDIATERLQALDKGNDRLMVIAKVPETFVRLMAAGYKPADVNIGAMARKPNSTMVGPNCTMSTQEVEDTEKLHQSGVRVWIQLVPFGGQKEIEWASVRSKLGLK